MIHLNHTHSRRVVRLLCGLLVSVVLAGCSRSPAAMVVPPAATTIAHAATVVPPVTATPAPTLTPTWTAIPSATVPPLVTATPVAMATAMSPVTPTATPAPRETPRVPAPPGAPSAEPPDVYAVVGVASDDVLNVRAGPGVANAIVGTIPPYGMGVQVTGDGQTVASSVWAPAIYGDVTGWVNTRYLARQVGHVDAAVAARANEIVQALRDRDWAALARFVHPDVGLRFSPYAYVRADSGAPGDLDRVVRADEIKALAADPSIYGWGFYDGTGDPIDQSFIHYVEEFVYDADFAQPHVVGYGETVGRGNTIDNSAEVYPDATVVEYHFTGFDPDLMGMDWRSLRLVLERKDGAWYLVGIVHDEWTI